MSTREELIAQMAPVAANVAATSAVSYSEALGSLLGASDLLASAQQRGRAEGIREAVGAVQAVYGLQCPPREVPYIEGERGARAAHTWWTTVLGGLLRELRERADAIERGRR